LGDHPEVRNPDLETWVAEMYAAIYLLFPPAATRIFRLRAARRSLERLGGT